VRRIDARRATRMKEGWNFTVVGCNSNNVPKYLDTGLSTYEEAVNYKEQMENIGWRRVAVFDAYLKEVKEKS
jgi:hypothetical protein